MEVTQRFLNQLAPYRQPVVSVRQQKQLAVGAEAGYMAAAAFQQIEAPTLTAKELRAWRTKNVWIYSAITQRRQEVSGADWVVEVVDPKKKTANDDYLIERVTELLNNPNPEGKNNSYQSLIEPIVDDLLILDKGCMVPIPSRVGDGPAALMDVDGSRVHIKKGWRGPQDGPRYIYLNADGTPALELRNDQLILMQASPTTYSAEGLSPLQVLYRILLAEYDTFRSVHILQKNRAPSGFFKMPSASKEAVIKAKDMFLKELAGKNAVGFMSIPADSEFIQLSSTNLAEQGAFAFYDMLIRAIAAAFQITTLQLNWLQDVNRATAQEQSDITDAGILNLLKLIQGYINREIVAKFRNSENIRFVYTQLMGKDEALSVEAIRELAGRDVNWCSINQMLELQGLPKITGRPKTEQLWYDYPLVRVANGQMSPVPVAVGLPQNLSADEQEQIRQENMPPQLALPGGGQGEGNRQPHDTQPQNQPKKQWPLTHSDRPGQRDIADAQSYMLNYVNSLFSVARATTDEEVAP